jgi:uncharacterized SAM-binding protein YcdF (DUF218 family)
MAFIVQLLEPYTFLLVGLSMATVWAWRTQRPRSRALRTATVLLGFLVLLSIPVTGYLALGSLEWSYPRTTAVPQPNDTIVVLSANVVVEDDTGRQFRLGQATFERCHYAARLYRQAGRCQIVLSGGKVDWSTPGPTFAGAMRDFMVEVGVRPDDLVLEEKSSTTYENALFSKPLLGELGGGRIFLVTDAAHMRRAQGCFRVQGVNVIPAPCNHHALRWEFSPSGFIPASRGILAVDSAAHEWLGALWYRLRGRI